ncbi:S8 family serine peptidase [Tahibacter soli]|uniref:S8 family serine peptidase n=1 Tax=Tahibacter soli TaxID=2983605 RepID=A0A9X3YG29_9GAMM|nr:S8 family serine peptidase [Tahibacter soli]MDC8011317.1 S8 family serine peptidase [Tahibacter soli]
MLIVAGAASAASVRVVAPQISGPDQLTDARVADKRLLLLRSGLVDPVSERVDYSLTGAAADVTVGRYAIVQFNEGDIAARSRLEKRGVRIVGYVPNSAYIVALDDAHPLTSVSEDSGVRWTGLYQPGMKLDPSLYADARANLKQAPQGGYEVDVYGFAGESAEGLAKGFKKVAGVSVVVVNERVEAPYVRLHVGDLAQLAALVRAATAQEGVSWVGHYLQPYNDNAGAVAAMQGNSTAATAGSGTVGSPTPLWDHNIFGSGQVVAISDSGLDNNEAWFTTLDKGAGPVTAITASQNATPPALGTPSPNNKLYGYWVQPGATAYDNNNTCPGGSPTSFHGTHTSGTIAGDAAGTFGATTYLASTPTAANHDLSDGMAPNAQLLFLDIGNDTSGCLSIQDLPGTIKQGYDAGTRIHSASWGAPSGGVYSGNDFDADFSLSQAEDMIFVVSAGNEGSAAQTIGSPGNAKNTITVGALGHAGSTTVVGFSSRGPTADGRRKPDIMGPGSSTISALGDTTNNGTPEAPLTQALSGTSMSAPTISGNMALMRQFFVDGFYPGGASNAANTYNPTGPALKAVALNGTNAISTANWNSNAYGWGRMWLDSNLWFSTTLTGGNDTRRLRLFERTNAAGIKTGEQHEYTIANVAASQELRATLTWYDIEAQPGNALSLVNNLDLEVIGPGGTYLGNVFTTGVSTTGGTADVRNTVEQFRLTAPTAGSYTFRVKGTNVPGGSRANTDRQGYALAVSGAFGLPAAAAFPAPTAVSATNAGGAVNVAFTAAGGAQGFQLYRANGTCAAAAAGDFRLVGTGAGSPLVDTTSQGGLTYAYKVRGVSGDVEGDVSNCVDVSSSAACTLQPNFNHDGVAVTNTTGSNCHIALGWQAAPAVCPGASGVTYSIARDSSPYFTGPSTIATALAVTTYDDTDVALGQPKYYRVTATDSLGNSAPASAIVAGSPVGPNGVDGNDYVENADPTVYSTLESPWRVTNTAAASGTYSFHAGPDGTTYPANVCTTMTSPTIAVQAGAVLSFKARYDIEYQWDGLVMEISTDGGTTWNDLPPDGGYPSNFSQTGSPPGNACGYLASHGAFNGVSTAASNADPNNGTATSVFKPFTRTLASYAGQNVKIRFRFSTDGGAEFSGVWLDDINLGGSGIEKIFRNGFETPGPFECQ